MLIMPNPRSKLNIERASLVLDGFRPRYLLAALGGSVGDIVGNEGPSLDRALKDVCGLSAISDI